MLRVPKRPSTHHSQKRPNWPDLVARIKTDDPGALEDLYLLFSCSLRYYLCRQTGAQEVEDKIHDVFVAVVQAIRRGQLRDPESLMGFVRTIARYHVAHYIDQVVQARKAQVELDSAPPISDDEPSPEQRVAAKEKQNIMEKTLGELSERDRDLLRRFYLLEQSASQICSEMNLTATQFRLLKSRAKARFGQLGKKRFLRRPLPTSALAKQPFERSAASAA